MHPIKFSIIIPTYNRADLIRETLNSILKQTYQNWEAIIIDDGSTDGTEEVVSSINDPRIIYHYKKNEERCVARNVGIEKSIGDYITFIDSDDAYYSECLEYAYKYLRTNPQAEIFHLAYEVRDRNTSQLLSNFSRRNDYILNESLLSGNIMSCMTTFMRKHIGRKYKFSLDQRLLFSEDWEYWLRISTEYKIYFHNKIGGILYEHPKRGVNQISIKKHIASKSFFMKHILKNEAIVQKYGNRLDKLKIHAKLYIALQYALTKEKKLSLLYILSAIKISFLKTINQRIFWGTIKNILFVK